MPEHKLASHDAEEKAAWRLRAVEWINASVPLDREWKATLLEMFLLWTDAAYNDGTDAAADVLAEINRARPSREMEVAANCIRELALRNRKDGADEAASLRI